MGNGNIDAFRCRRSIGNGATQRGGWEFDRYENQATSGCPDDVGLVTLPVAVRNFCQTKRSGNVEAGQRLSSGSPFLLMQRSAAPSAFSLPLRFFVYLLRSATAAGKQGGGGPTLFTMVKTNLDTRMGNFQRAATA